MLSTFSAIIFCMMNRFIRFYGVMKWKVEYRSILLSPTYGEKVQKRKIKDKYCRRRMDGGQIYRSWKVRRHREKTIED